VRVIKAEFRRLDEHSLPSLIGAVGVYVMWDGQARARPTYFGEGTILKRLAEHPTRFALPFDGAGGARRLGNESFFSAPQLKRDRLGSTCRRPSRLSRFTPISTAFSATSFASRTAIPAQMRMVSRSSSAPV